MSEGSLVKAKDDGKGFEGEFSGNSDMQSPGFATSEDRGADLPAHFQTMAELTGAIDTRLADTSRLADAVQDLKLSLERTEEVVRQTHLDDHIRDEEYESRLSAVTKLQTGTEREDAMMKHVEKCADGLLEAIHTSIEAKLDQKMNEFQENTGMAMRRLEEALESVLANQAVSHLNF
jgi:hypothetical protein